jgi:hypothetical protein
LSNAEILEKVYEISLALSGCHHQLSQKHSSDISRQAALPAVPDLDDLGSPRSRMIEQFAEPHWLTGEEQQLKFKN